MIVATHVEQVELPDEALYEIVDGVKVEKPMSVISLWLASELSHSLGPFVKTHRLGFVVSEMIFVLDRTTNLRRRPDLAFVSAKRWPLDRRLPYHGDWEVVPDLAIEVASPTNTFENLAGKVREYFQYGAEEVWILLPEAQEVYVYQTARTVRILQAKDTLSTERIPDWSIVVGDLIPNPPTSETPSSDERKTPEV